MLKRLLAVSVLAFFASPLHASPAEDAYFAARADFASKIKAAIDGKKGEKIVDKLDEDARQALQKQLAALVGPKIPTGYAAPGEYSIATLQPENPAADLLDAIVFVKGEKDPAISVTPEGIAAHWLAALAAVPENKGLNLPTNLADTVKEENFYTVAFGGDGAFSLYAAVPTPGQPATVSARLGIFREEAGADAPDTLVVSVQRDGLLYVIQAAVAKPLAKQASCDALWKPFGEKAEKAHKAFEASKQKDEAQEEAAEKAAAEGDEVFRACYVKLITPADFAELGKQAEELVKLIP